MIKINKSQASNENTSTIPQLKSLSIHCHATTQNIITIIRISVYTVKIKRTQNKIASGRQNFIYTSSYIWSLMCISWFDCIILLLFHWLWLVECSISSRAKIEKERERRSERAEWTQNAREQNNNNNECAYDHTYVVHSIEWGTSCFSAIYYWLWWFSAMLLKSCWFHRTTLVIAQNRNCKLLF